MAGQKISRIFSTETKILKESRSPIAIISTTSPDRDGNIVVPKSSKLAMFLKNPGVLFGHKYNELAIAKAPGIVVDDHTVKAKGTFPTEGVYPFADTINVLIKEGISERS